MGKTNPICIIPARGISPGLPKKNLKLVNDKPLVAYTIETAVESPVLQDVFVSTEDEKIANIAKECGAKVPFLRPEKLSQKGASLQSVTQYFINNLKKTDSNITEATPIVILQPHVPFRKSEDIERAVNRFESKKEVVISVIKEQKFYWRKDGANLKPVFDDRHKVREDLEPLYHETGSITVTTPEKIQNDTWTGSSPDYIITDKLSSFEVNSVVDFSLAQKIARGIKFIFRVDGGNDIGLGKVYRAVTLATELNEMFNCDIHFISDEKYAGGVEFIQSNGFSVSTSTGEEDLDEMERINPDVVFLDIEDVNEQYMQRIHKMSAALVNLEDLEDGLEQADFVINPQQSPQLKSDSNQLFGTDYFILREEFQGRSATTRENAENILLTFGGSDPLNLTVDTVRVLGDADLPFSYRLIIGPDFNRDEELFSLPNSVLNQFDIRYSVQNMGDLMEWADIAISSGGRTVYELAATGTPSIVIAQNSGEIDRMKLLVQQGIIEFLGHGNNVDFHNIPSELEELANDVQRRSIMSNRGQQIVDGQGIQRILKIVEEILMG